MSLPLDQKIQFLDEYLIPSFEFCPKRSQRVSHLMTEAASFERLHDLMRVFSYLTLGKAKQALHDLKEERERERQREREDREREREREREEREREREREERERQREREERERQREREEREREREREREERERERQFALQQQASQRQQFPPLPPQEANSLSDCDTSSTPTSNFGIDERGIWRLVDVDTLEMFINELSGLPCPVIYSDPSIFETYRLQLGSTNGKKLTEGQLQDSYFKTVEKYGDNVLESTKTSNNEFQKLNFASWEGNTKYPDLTLRVSTPADGDELPPSDLPNWRLFPWAVIAYLELKKTNVSVNNHVHQALYYAQSTLLCCPARTYCLTALYNFNQIIFCGVKCVDGKLRHYTSSVITQQNASREISKFLSCPASLLGFDNSYPFDRYTPVDALGRGSTSVCVSFVNSNNSVSALKISRDHEALTIEKSILQYLHSVNTELHIPTIIATPELSLNFTVMQPVYTRSSGQLKVDQFLKAWDALHEVHKFGICHRDARMPNLGVIGQTFHWMDWSSARPFREIDDLRNIQQYRLGSTCTASRPVLRRMIDNLHDYVCFPSDEGISMINLVYLRLFCDRSLQNPQIPDAALGTWNSIMKLIPKPVLDTILTLEGIGENYDEANLDIINTLVRNAIRALFEKRDEKRDEENSDEKE